MTFQFLYLITIIPKEKKGDDVLSSKLSILIVKRKIVYEKITNNYRISRITF